MKLIDEVPTAEILAIISNEKEVFDSPEALYAALYAAVPETQQELVAEIAKRDVRIKELGSEIEIEEHRFNQLFDDYAQATQLIEEQAAEISRLKGVIAKCKETLVSSIFDLQEQNFATLAAWRIKEALAAIKKEGL